MGNRNPYIYNYHLYSSKPTKTVKVEYMDGLVDVYDGVEFVTRGESQVTIRGNGEEVIVPLAGNVRRVRVF